MQGVGQDNSSTHKFIAFNATNQVYSGAAFETWNDANILTYGLTATRIGTTSGYKGTDIANAVRWELWYWTGTLSTSYPVYDGIDTSGVVLANVAQINSQTASATAMVDFDLIGNLTGPVALEASLQGAISDIGGISGNIPANFANLLITAEGWVTLTGDYDAAKTAATQASVNAIAGYIDTEVAAIKVKTDLIPASPAAVGSAMTLAAGSITAAVVATGAIDADALAADAAAEIAAAVAAASSGTGAFARTVTVTPPLEGAMVRMTSGGSFYEATTNASGIASLSLDAATYTLTVSAVGYQHTPQTVVVSAAGNTAATMTATGGNVTPSTDPELSNAYTTVRNSMGTPIVGYQLSIVFVRANRPVDLWRKTPITATSGVGGLIQQLLVTEATYRAGGKEFTVGTDPTYQMEDMTV